MKKMEIGNAVVYCGDCREILSDLSFDGVLTDPPYGMAYETGWSSPWQGQIANDGDTTCRDTALQMIGEKPALVFGVRKMPPPPKTRMILVWDKGPALGMGALDLPWKPTYEEIYVLGKGFSGHRGGAVIYQPPVQSMAKNGRLHPNEKPVALLKTLLLKMPVETICDPFMGSGSTGVAAMEMGKKFVGIEVEPKYFDIACKRIEQAQQQLKLF